MVNDQGEDHFPTFSREKSKAFYRVRREAWGMGHHDMKVHEVMVTKRFDCLKTRIDGFASLLIISLTL
jgi:hypothetical protein